MSKDCWAQKNGHYKKFEKAERAIGGDEDDLVLCLLMRESKKEIKKKKVRFMEDIKQSLEAGMMCTIDGDTFFSFTKNTWIGDSGASCHITNNDTGLYDIIDFDESTQGSSSIMPATKTGKLQVKVWQVDETEQVHTLCCEVLPHGRSKHVFANVQTIAGKQDIK